MNGKFYLLFLINIPLAAVMIIAEYLNGYVLGYATSASANGDLEKAALAGRLDEDVIGDS